MAAPQKDVIARPDAMVMRACAKLCARLYVNAPMIMAVTMTVSVVVPMIMIVRMQGVVVRHGGSLARRAPKIPQEFPKKP